jgi:hypothetical protein
MSPVSQTKKEQEELYKVLMQTPLSSRQEESSGKLLPYRYECILIDSGSNACFKNDDRVDRLTHITFV